MRNHVVIFMLLCGGIPVQLSAQSSVDFSKDVQPILQENCIGCHRGDSAPSGLQLDTAAGVLKGGSSGAVVVPGDAGKSILAQRVSDAAGNQMPPNGPLAKEKIALIVDWINQGAKADVPQGQSAQTAAPARPRGPAPAIAAVANATQEHAMLDYYCVVCHQGSSAPK